MAPFMNHDIKSPSDAVKSLTHGSIFFLPQLASSFLDNAAKGQSVKVLKHKLETAKVYERPMNIFFSLPYYTLSGNNISKF